MSVPPGSYILPSDVISAVGQNNTEAGAQILGSIFKIGSHGGESPEAVATQTAVALMVMCRLSRQAARWSLHPEIVAEIGGGDMKAGHKILNAFCLRVRREHIAQLKRL